MSPARTFNVRTGDFTDLKYMYIRTCIPMSKLHESCLFSSWRVGLRGMASDIHFRAAQMYHFYSVINTSYKIKAAKVKSNLLAYLAVACFLAVLLVLLLVIIYYQMRKTVRMKEALSKSHKKLKELNETLNEMNQELNKHNDSLMELNEVKEKYIAQFFELCSEYIDKMEIYQTEIYKLTINRHYEALLKRLKSTTFIDKELDSLYMHFDSIFLSLYPNFPDKFNALLEEKERVFPNLHYS